MCIAVQAYSLDDALAVRAGVEGLANGSWSDAAVHPIDWDASPFPKQVDCCALLQVYVIFSASFCKAGPLVAIAARFLTRSRMSITIGD